MSAIYDRVAASVHGAGRARCRLAPDGDEGEGSLMYRPRRSRLTVLMLPVGGALAAAVGLAVAASEGGTSGDTGTAFCLRVVAPAEPGCRVAVAHAPGARSEADRHQWPSGSYEPSPRADGTVYREQLIGNFSRLELSGGAAVGTIDRVDDTPGAPPTALSWRVRPSWRVATGNPPTYQLVGEHVNAEASLGSGPVNPLVCPDLDLTKYLGGGAVFSTSSVAWSGGPPEPRTPTITFSR